MLVECAVMDTAEAQPSGVDCLYGCLQIAHDVRCIEESTFLEAADCALTHVRRQFASPKACLMQSCLRLAHDVSSLNRIFHSDGLLFIERPNHCSGCDDYEAGHGIVARNEARKHWAVPAWTRADEVNDRHFETVCRTDC